MNYLKNFYLKFREYFNIALWVFVLIKSSALFRMIDPTAAPIDLGQLSAILYAGVTVMVFKNLTWLLIKTIWPTFADYAMNKFTNDFEKLLPWERLKTFLLFYGFWALLLVVALRSYL